MKPKTVPKLKPSKRQTLRKPKPSLPRRFPASFKDLLRLVVRARDHAAGTALVRDLYRGELRHGYGPEHGRGYGPERLLTAEDREEIEYRAAAEIAGWKATGFTRPQWDPISCG